MAAAGPTIIPFTDNPLTNASFMQSRLTAISVIAKYLWLLIWPLNLSCDYSFNQIHVATGSVRDWLACLIVLAIVSFAVAAHKRSTAGFFFAVLALVSFTPVSNLLFFTGSIMAERFLYVPSVGFAACVVMIAYAAARRANWPKAAPIVLSLVILAAGVRTWERNFDWHDDESLWTATVQAAPNSFKAHQNLAFALQESDPTHLNLPKAIAEDDKSLAILNPLPDSLNTPFPYSNAGAHYLTKGDILAGRAQSGSAESASAYQKALELYNRGIAIDKALNDAIRRKEASAGISAPRVGEIGAPELYGGIATAYLRLGQNQEASDAAAQALSFAPRDVAAYQLMAQSLLALDRKEDAAVALLQGLVLTGDQHLMPFLKQAYDHKLDPDGCAFIQTTDGTSLNGRCRVVHKDLCAASAAVIRSAAARADATLVEEARAEAVTKFGCSNDELSEDPPQPE